MVPYLQLSEENRALLNKLQQQDIDALIGQYRQLLRFEWGLLLLLGALLLYLLWKYFGPKIVIHNAIPLKAQLEKIGHLRDQTLFLNESAQFIRTVVRERLHVTEQGLTDLELFAYFQKTPLRNQSEQALSLIDQGRFSTTPLTAAELTTINTFLHDIVNF